MAEKTRIDLGFPSLFASLSFDGQTITDGVVVYDSESQQLFYTGSYGGAGGTSGVIDLNSLSGSLNIVGGIGISINSSSTNGTITITATGESDGTSGTSGTSGTTGTSGTSGVSYCLFESEYGGTVNSNPSNPGDGKFKILINSSTRIDLNTTSSNGTDIEDLLLGLTPPLLLKLTKTTDSTVWRAFRVTNIDDNTNYVYLNTTLLDSSGTLNIGDDFCFQITEAGTSGTSGTSGTTGTSGTSGTTGTSGTSGTTGTSGTSGTTGTSGTSGTTGTSGTSGTTGTSGTSGTSISLTIVSGSTTGTGIERLEISGSGDLIISNNNTASITIEGGGIFTDQETYYNTSNTLQITGSTLELNAPGTGEGTSSVNTGGYAFLVSESIYSYNHNVGYPKSNAWNENLEGSYFENFTANTNTSEILRFVAGLLSSSAPSPTPNTKYYAGITGVNSSESNGINDVPEGFVPQSSTNTGIIYLKSKGFANEGENIFRGITNIQKSGNFRRKYNSVAGGSTTVSSSNDGQLFGIGSLSDTFYVSTSIEWNFSSQSNEIISYQDSEEYTKSNTTENTTSNDGIERATIPTSNPSVIPAVYQDGKFENFIDQTQYFSLKNNLDGGSSVFNNVTESVGYYYITASIAIRTGSQVNYSTYYEDKFKIFGCGTTSFGIDGTELYIPDNTLSIIDSPSYIPLTATSRSLSGAPYLLTATWEASGSIGGVFNPLYRSGSFGNVTLAQFLALSNVVNESGKYTIQNQTGGGTLSASDIVYSSDGTTSRAVGEIPHETDIIRLTASFATDFSDGDTNIDQIGSSSATFLANLKGFKPDGTSFPNQSVSIPWFTAGTFGQSPDSGSMVYYKRNQGYDGGTLTTFAEAFTGENYRIGITDKLLSGSYDNGDKFTTGSYYVNNLGGLDLQVKPGYLVKPGGTYGYWLTDPDNTKVYKFYARAFKRDLTNAAVTMTLNVGTTLNSWESTSDGVSAAIIFQSSGIENYTTPIIYDPTQLTSNLISASISNDNHKNPFSNNIALRGNIGGNLNSNTYTVPLRNGDGMILDGNDQNFIVIIRYKGDPSPVTGIAISIS